MRPVSAVLGLVTLFVGASLQDAFASPPPFDVGKGNIDTLPYTFAFTNEEREGLIQMEVAITPKKGSLSPGLLARVHLIDGTTEMATIPLEETREGGKVTYWFRLAPAFIAKSRFEFDILSGKEEHLPNGETRFIGEPGTLEYDFKIRDFVATKLSAKAGAVRVRSKGSQPSS